MILVNDPGNGRAVYWPLDHAAWDGATPTDMIFPCFLVMVGVSMTMSFAARLARGATHRSLFLHALRRGALIVLIGLVINALPHFHFSRVRIPGVLQRIGVCYIVSATLYLALPGPDEGKWRRMREVVIAAVTLLLLVGYWMLLKLYPTPGFGAGRLDSLGSLPAVVDRALFGVHHIWRYAITPGYGPTYDPEGLLSTLPSIATLLLGVLAGEQLRTSKTRATQCGVLASMGTVLWLSGLVLSHWMPLNKKLWTSTFAMFSAGIAILLLAGFLYVIDVRGVRRGWECLLIFGTNATFAYVVADLLAIAFYTVHVAESGRPVTVQAWVYEHAFAGWLQPYHASLAYAIAFVLVIAAMVYPLYRRRIYLRL